MIKMIKILITMMMVIAVVFTGCVSTKTSHVNKTMSTAPKIGRHPGSIAEKFSVIETDHDPYQPSKLKSGRHIVRKEVRTAIGGSGWYGMSIYIPDGELDLGGGVYQSKTYVGQWLPKTTFGQPPSVANCIMNDNFYIKIAWAKAPKQFTVSSSAPPSAGWRQELIWITDFKRGEWNDFVYQLKFSSKPDGFVNVWLNGKQVVKYQGPTTFKFQGTPSLKIGVYARRGIAPGSRYAIYYDEVQSGSGYEKVDPSNGKYVRLDLQESEAIIVTDRNGPSNRVKTYHERLKKHGFPTYF